MAQEFDAEARYAALGERVDNQGRRLADLDAQMRSEFAGVNTQLRSLAEDIRSGSKTQWPLIIGFGTLAMSILAGLGFLTLQPVKESVADFKAMYEANRLIARNDLNATFLDIRTMLKETIPRTEFERITDGINQRFQDHQRQIDANAANNSNVYTARDQIVDMRNQMKDVINELSDVKAELARQRTAE